MKGNVNQDYILEARRSIGARIRAIREERELTMQELADLMNIDKATVSKIEAGKWSPSIDMITRFSVALGFKIELN
jgi:transcriptional regulator with XRE-family HTH domain